MSDLHEVQYLRAAIARRGADPSRAIGLHPARRLVVAALVVAAIAFIAIGMRSLPWGRSALSFRTEGGDVQGNGYLRAGPTAPAVLHSSDGTQVSFHEGARGRVVGVQEHGARIALDEGTVQVQVVSRPGASWTFDAGPFSVNFTGGAFLLTWKGDEAYFDLRLDQGSATVSGPLLHDARALRAGERMTLALAEQKIAIRQGEDAEPSPLETEVSVLRSFLADRGISTAPNETRELRGDRVASDPARRGESADLTAPRPRPAAKR
jgi:ferric-dicitrate binding protein FerR (iron transport regulator)